MRKFFRKIGKSPINYFSDLFITAMVCGWIAAIPIICIAAAYAMIVLQDASVWDQLTELVTVPLTAGGAIWMIKNSVQHALAAKNGKRCKYDFPKVNADGEDDGKEERMQK